MNHLARLLSTLTMLQSKRLVTGPELAEKFNVSVRTIYRDMKKLEESGVPVITIEGRGYTLMDGYKLAPGMFDEMEINALVTAEQIISRTNDESLIEHFNSTLQKIKAVFRGSMLDQAELMNSKMHIRKRTDAAVKSSSLTHIQSAIVRCKLVEMNYQVPGKQVTKRTIEPLAIFSVDEKWIVVAWCHLRNNHRVFRLDRIIDFKVLDKGFEDRGFDLGEFFRSCENFQTHP